MFVRLSVHLSVCEILKIARAHSHQSDALYLSFNISNCGHKTPINNLKILTHLSRNDREIEYLRAAAWYTLGLDPFFMNSNDIRQNSRTTVK